MNFRKSETSSGKELIAGKSAEQNEEVIKLAGKEELVFHTKAAGSPFVILKSKKTSSKDKKESAIFCAAFSKDFKQNQRDTEVHYFRGKDIYKDKSMKLGTFGVKKAKSLIVKKSEILKWQQSQKLK